MPDHESRITNHVFTYDIGGQKYIQKKLVLGQIEQMIELLEGTSLPGELTAQAVLGALKGKIYSALAIALTEEGKSPRDKDIDALADVLKWEMDYEQVLQVIEDFFVCSPIASILKRLAGMMIKMKGQVKAAGLKISSAPSPEGISSSGTESNGDLPLTTPAPTSSSEAEK